jgi:hypothetical protein
MLNGVALSAVLCGGVFMAITEHWRVVVFADGEQILAIEPEMLAGADITDDYADTIRHCARHLLSFVGPEHQNDFFNMPHN